MTDTDKSELEKQIRDIIKSPMRSQISTADIAVNMMSSTGLSEKVHSLSALITQQCNQARIDEAKHYHLQYAHELSHLQRGFEKNNLTDKGLGCYEALKDLDEFHKRNIAHLQAQAKETEK